ncbi:MULTISPECIES: DUF3025 domain-containing protein [unclassified Acidovorax]|uniref:DUF3025 domain-containing protein n=1 Tax=unclassified Acidovorax TaxID=2684926 RepID=UPI002883120B|nr:MULTISPECIES: DUF3025 domain-containing protein [unclassified Acidovorax]
MSSTQALADIDWARPWLAPYAASGQTVAARALATGSVGSALDAQAAQALGAHLPRFQGADMPPGLAYESFIHTTRTVPTRDNLHDFFNGLIWLHYPQTKRLLNQWQAQAIAAQGIGAVRGPLRDAITVFDENGAVLFAPAALCDALRERAWRRLFVDLRPLWAEATLLLFGHALLEKLVQPRKPITAHVYCVQGAIDSVAQADAWLARTLDAGAFAAKPFNPLPVLGVPGWWPENENFCFYDDSLVFRSRRPA